MKDLKQFVEDVLKMAAEDMADGSDYWPHAYFLMPNESLDLFLIDPNYMATPRSKDALRALILKHLRDRNALYAVLVSDAWQAIAEIPKGATGAEARQALPDDLSTFEGRTEVVLASIFGEGMEPLLVQWPYKRADGKPIFEQERIIYSDPGTKIAGRFAPDLTHGRRPA